MGLFEMFIVKGPLRNSSRVTRSPNCALLLAVAVSFSLLCGCNRPAIHSSTNSSGKAKTLNYQKSPLQDFVALPSWRMYQGIEGVHVDLGVEKGAPGSASTIYIYRPPGEHPMSSMPCVFVAAAGGTSFSGKAIGAGDDPELIPYAQNGFVVVGYETDGDYEFEDEDGIDWFLKYQNSEAGLVNASHAIEYALKMLPEIDPNRLYAVGHSSAGRQAMLLAAHETRVKGAVSFNGVLDVFSWANGNVDETLEFLPPGSREFLLASSPIQYTAQIDCPIFLFHTGEDEVVPQSQSIAFAKAIRAARKSVKTEFPSMGDHYQPMLEIGLPQAIEWLKKIDKQHVK